MEIISLCRQKLSASFNISIRYLMMPKTSSATFQVSIFVYALVSEVFFFLPLFSRCVARNQILSVAIVRGTAVAMKIQKSRANTIVDVAFWKLKKFIPKKVYRSLAFANRPE